MSASCVYDTARCVDSVCAARVAIGATCDSANLDFEQCANHSVCTENVCKAQPARGDVCTDDVACGGYYVCRQGFCSEKKQDNLALAPKHCVLLP